MKTLFFSHQASFVYGGEIVTLAFARELKERGVEVHFASPAGPYHELAREAGALCHEVPSRQFSRDWRALPSLAASFRATRAALRGILRGHAIPVLHATSLKAMAYAWGLGRERPVLWHHHDILPAGLANSLWLRGLAAGSARILVPSAAARAALLGGGVGAAKVHVLHNGFRLADWRPRPPRKPGHLFRIGMVGELSRRKGSDRLAPILAALGAGPEIQVLVIGEGLSEPAFAAELKSRLASRQVRFLGRRERMKELYQEMDVLLVPSRQDPLPTVIVEAGLSGVPVVGSRVGGIPEMIVDGRNGFLFGTDEEAARAIRKAEADWESLSRGARSLAEERFDIAKLADELLRHYREIGAGV